MTTAAVGMATGGGTAPALPLASLFVAAALPVLKVAMLCGVGAVAARTGILTLDGRRCLSGLIFNVFTPALFLSSLGSSLGVNQAIQLWPLTVNMVLSNIVGLLLGVILVRVARVPLDLHNHLLVATGIGNTGNLPLVLVASLGNNPALPSLMGSADLGLQYVILASFSATLIQFPLVNTLLKRKDDPEAAPLLDHGPPSGDVQPKAVAPPTPASTTPHPGPTPTMQRLPPPPTPAVPQAAPPAPRSAHPISYPIPHSQSWPTAMAGTDVELGPVRPVSAMTGCSPGQDGQPGKVQQGHPAPFDGSSRQQYEDLMRPPPPATSHPLLGEVPGAVPAAGQVPAGGSAGQQHDVWPRRLVGWQGALKGEGGEGREGPGAELLGAELSCSTPGGSVAAEEDCVPLLQHQGPEAHAYTYRSDAGRHGQADGHRDGGAMSSSSSSNTGNGNAGLSGRSQGVGEAWRQLRQRAWGATPPRWQRRWLQAQPVVAGTLSAPTLSMLLALFIASVPPLQAALFSPTGSLRMAGEVMGMFGACCIPSLMLGLGANLSQGPGVAKVPLRVILATMLCRLIILPLCGTALITLPFKAGWFSQLHPIGILCMYIIHSTPTAIIVHAIATMHRNREDDIASILFWEYLASIVTLPLFIALYLHIVVG